MSADRSKRPVLITGGGGFIGQSVIARLLPVSVEVRNVDFIPGRIAAPNLNHWLGSFLDPTRMREALIGVDTVYHIAATRFPREANRDPLEDARENIIGTLALLDLAVESGVRRVVFCSSGGTVYGPTDRVPIPEDHPTNPVSAYGITKLAIEKYLRLYHSLHGLSTLSLRVANPYGPGQNISKAQGALTTFCHKAVADDEIEIWGDGSVERDFVHIDDVARALVMAGHSDVSGTELNIGSGQGTSLNTLIALIEAALDRPVRHRYLPGRDFDVPRNHLDISRARTLLGWYPEIGLPEGIARMLNSLDQMRRGDASGT